MDFLSIPFVEKVGLDRDTDGRFLLPGCQSNHNHLETVHASAQFMLAETASGGALVDRFGELEGQVVPVLRGSEIKFKRPATGTVSARAQITSEAADQFSAQFERRGRGTVDVQVDVLDADEKVTCTGVFSWFIQKVEQKS